LLELSRQRSADFASANESHRLPALPWHRTYPLHRILCVHILRILQEEAMKDGTAAVHAQVPIDVATYLPQRETQRIPSIVTRLKVNCS